MNKHSDYLKLDGIVVVNDYEMASSSIAAGLAEYPEGCIEELRKHFTTYSLNAAEIAASLGSSNCMNIVLFGSMVKALGMESIADWEAVIREIVPAKFAELNIDAYRAGYGAIN
ncbi:MAG: 2-oxoacid:acceptor oxidoreductase family protein [Clostridia bacterium]|nr:2-oxoacid:acceptor oxidoreductase family protein [Clostridia bacterium]